MESNGHEGAVLWLFILPINQHQIAVVTIITTKVLTRGGKGTEGA
jgi:hypothetical protein